MARKIRLRRPTSRNVDLETTLGGGRILADPELLPNWGKTELSVLPLLFDRLLLPHGASILTS
jgi:hypothetical protein